MNEMHLRSAALLGEEAIELLREAHVAVFGIGGVGGHAAEALVRGGVGSVTLVDPEKFDLTNLNRQLFSTTESIGTLKVEAAKKRLLSICPECNVRLFPIFYEESEEMPDILDGVDYIVDAIDSVSSKLFLYKRAEALNIPVVASMGTGNKLDPTAFRVADIYKTRVCPLAKAVRVQCRKLGIEKLKVVYSEEEPRHSPLTKDGKPIPASVSFVPGVAGMILAGEVIKDLTKHVYHRNG